jgi:hypothetical protein
VDNLDRGLSTWRGPRTVGFWFWEGHSVRRDSRVRAKAEEIGTKEL